MSPLVVDASVVVKWFLPEELADAALRLAEDRHAFIAPELLGAEFANVLWKKRRRGEIDGAEAAALLADFGRLDVRTFPLGPLLEEALAIALAAGHSVYDCLYLALADHAQCPLVTADRRFFHAFAAGPLGHRMRWIADA